MGEINKSKVLACGPILAELGWELFAFSGIIRFLNKHSLYKNHTCLVMANKGHYPIYQFADQFVPIPSWFDNYGFISASYDMPNMPADIYGNLIKYFRRFYYEECKEVFELRTPRTHTFTLVQTNKQYFEKLTPTGDGIFLRDALLKNFPKDKEILVVMPRYRVMPEEAQFGENKFNDMRNWPPLFWQDLIARLLNDGYLLVIAGTQNGIPPINYNLPNVINLANLDSTYIMDVTLAFMEVALGTIGSQSGGTHLALQACSPTWVLGHEVQRHAVDCNPLKTPCVYCDSGLPYANIFPEVAYESVKQFIEHIKKNIKASGCEICDGSFSHSGVKDVIECNGCGLYRKQNIPDKAVLLNNLGQATLGYFSNENSIKERTKEAEFELDFISEFFTEGKLYDVGAGNGLFLDVASNRGFDVSGNELSVLAVNLAKEKYNIDLQYGMLEDMENDEDYDAFVLWHTLEHTVSPVTTLRYCYNHLKSGGVVLVGVPIKDKNDLEKRYEDLHLYEFNESTIEKLLIKCGFKIDKSIVRSPNNDTQINIVGRKL